MNLFDLEALDAIVDNTDIDGGDDNPLSGEDGDASNSPERIHTPRSRSRSASPHRNQHRKRKTNIRGRNWVFTLNNPKRHGDELKSHLQSDARVRYFVFQLERGSNGTPHFQGYIEFNTSMRWSAVCNMLPGAWVDLRKGTPEDARKYATKDETRLDGPWEYGEFRGRQGRRSDLERAAELIEQKKSIRDVAKHYPSVFIRYHRGLREYQQLMTVNEEPRNFKTEVIVCFGDTGAGKTYWVYKDIEEKKYSVYTKENPRTKNHINWWTGYKQEDAVVIDDIEPDMWNSTELIRIMDAYECRVMIATGSYVQFRSKIIYITCRSHPVYWGDIEQLDAIKRRITHVYEFNERNGEHSKKEIDKYDPFKEIM